MKSSLRARLTVAVASVLTGLALAAPSGAEGVLRAVVHADLKNLDPIWTTAYITRNHGYMVYDTLFALDENLVVRPQMVGDHTVSDDRLTYRFTLRDGLEWHDGTPVTAADCVASIKRWGARDGMGQKLMDMTASLTEDDAQSFTLVLKAPYGQVLESLGKISSNVPFMMPKRLAETDPFKQVSEIVGSGPFKFVKEEWVPGNKVVYVRNADYVPRAEAPSGAAGGKVAKIDRVEWLYIPDASTAMNALINGEIDYYELPPADLLPIMQATPGIKVEVLDPLGNQGWIRLNHLHPPFDNIKARQAMLYLVKQTDYLQAAIGNPDYFRPCAAIFGCGTPYESTIGAEPALHPDVEKAKALFAESGYDGRPVVVLQATDISMNSGAALVTAQLLRDIGVTVELQAIDWSTLTSRRAVKEPPDKGGWNIFHTWWLVADVLNPVGNIGISGGCTERAWFGWPCDEEIERLRDQFARTADPAERKALAEAIQARAYGIVTHVTWGQFDTPVAYRDNLEGLIGSPVPFFWNIAKR